MTAVSLGIRNVAWNTAVTFGIACVGGAVAWTTSKFLHRTFRIREHIMQSPSLLVRAAAVVAGGAAAYGLASRATPVSFPHDSQFYKFHCLHLLFGMFFLGNGMIVNAKETRTAALMMGSVGALLLLSSSGTENRHNLFAAGAVGITAGLRL
jgi:hypothetical protein